MAGAIGSSLKRPEGPDKVTGRALYVADLSVPGVWVGGTVRSPVASGRLTGFDLDPDFDFGRVALVRAVDIPGDNVVALIVDDMPLLVERDIAHVGEALMLVAAPDAETLAAALAGIRPRIEPSIWLP